MASGMISLVSRVAWRHSTKADRLAGGRPASQRSLETFYRLGRRTAQAPALPGDTAPLAPPLVPEHMTGA